MNDMEEKRDNKEIRVRLHHIDRGNCTEVWEVQTEKGKPRRYLGRDDGYGPKEWYTLCDAPYGYCERDCHVREDLTLIVCDKDWNGVLRDGTDRERFPESFPSLDEACNEAWSKVVKVLPACHAQRFRAVDHQTVIPPASSQNATALAAATSVNPHRVSSESARLHLFQRSYHLPVRHPRFRAEWRAFHAFLTTDHPSARSLLLMPSQRYKIQVPAVQQFPAPGQ